MKIPVSYTHLDMDILKQCQKWHEEDKHQKIVDALEAVSYTHLSRPSVRDKLKQELPAHKPAAPKKREPER